MRVSWVFFLLSVIFESLDVILEAFVPPVFSGNFPGILIMAGYSLLAIGIALLPSVPVPENLKKELNTPMGVFIGVSLIATWIFLILPSIYKNTPINDRSYAAMMYILVFAVLDLLIRRRHWDNRKIIIYLCFSVATMVLGNILVAIRRTEAHLWISILINLCWFTSYASLALAGFTVGFEKETLQQSMRIDRISELDQNIEFILPASWVGLTYILLIWSHSHTQVISFEVVAAGTGSLLIVLLFRFNNALKENARLISEAKREIDSRKRMQEKFWHDSRHDPLTALPNRSYLLDQIMVAIDTSRATGKINSVLLFLDLDRFKLINDKYGHDTGDQLLKAISERLIFCVRPDDFVARLGGDEFAILLNNLQSSQTVYKIAGRIMEKMREPFNIQGISLISGISFGIYFIEPGDNSPEVILKEADKAMYRAKQNGRGRFEVSKAFEF